MIRPVLRSLPSTVTSALSAAAYGAMRWGAGIGSASTSGRRRASFMARTASVNSGGSGGGPEPGRASLPTTMRSQ